MRNNRNKLRDESLYLNYAVEKQPLNPHFLILSLGQLFTRATPGIACEKGFLWLVAPESPVLDDLTLLLLCKDSFF